MVLTEDGRLYTMGRGARGVLGHGDDLLLLQSPRQIDNIFRVSLKITGVDLRGEHVVAVTDTGEVLTWGANAEGQLGHGDTQDRLRPEKVSALAMRTVTSAVAGTAHGAVVTVKTESSVSR